MRPSALPLCVDLDGTLIRSDILYESALVFIKRNPLQFWKLPLWLLSGKATLKAQIARVTDIDLQHLPFQQEVLDFVRSEHSSGRRVLIASASNIRYVREISEGLGFGSDVVASDDSVNMRSAQKAKALIDLFGERGFDYIGNDHADLAVWSVSNRALVVTDSKSLLSSAGGVAQVERVFHTSRGVFRPLLKGIRAYQWLKNILVFLPLFLAHSLFDWSRVFDSVLAFISFSFCASAVYVLNDLLDLEADRVHPRKKRRAWASGDLSIPFGLSLIPIFLLSSFLIAMLLNPLFIGLLLLYLITTTAYSLALKQIALVDIMVLAGLYTIRILAGAVASDLVVSKWLLGLSLFLFISLACVKRFSEMFALLKRNESRLHGRGGYRAEDAEQIAIFGSTSGYIAALVLAFYVSSEEVTKLYKNPGMIWLACPLLLYWVSRVWLFARRGRLHDDPLIFALRDKGTYGVMALMALVFYLAL